MAVQDRVGMGAGVSGMTGDDDMYEVPQLCAQFRRKQAHSGTVLVAGSW